MAVQMISPDLTLNFSKNGNPKETIVWNSKDHEPFNRARIRTYLYQSWFFNIRWNLTLMRSQDPSDPNLFLEATINPLEMPLRFTLQISFADQAGRIAQYSHEASACEKVFELIPWAENCSIQLDIIYHQLSESPYHNSLLMSSIRRLQLINHDSADFIIKLSTGETIKLHKMILEFEWPYYAMLKNFAEGQTDTVTITEHDHLTIKGLIIFIYTGYLPYLSAYPLLLMMKAADYYGMDKLASICKDRLMNINERDIDYSAKEDIKQCFILAKVLDLVDVSITLELAVITNLQLQNVFHYWCLANQMNLDVLRDEVIEMVSEQKNSGKISCVRDLPGFFPNDPLVINLIVELIDAVHAYEKKAAMMKSLLVGC